jgi:sugar/nucleoside kinase (ribokinase family)
MTRRTRPADVVVAGHICLDVIPTFPTAGAGGEEFFVPGKLRVVGAPAISTGGAVTNTGLALHRLGIPVRLVGKIGDDDLGHIVLNVLQRHDEALSAGVVVSRRDPTSYTIVLNPPGRDRMFLHCPGANDTLCARDITADHWRGARIFHFGYPPLMRRMYLENGQELATLFARVKKAGLTTSLDMAQPDPASEAGQLAWAALLDRVLPQVDVFLPSSDEILYMLDPRTALRLQRLSAARCRLETLQRLPEVASQLLERGVAIVVLKLGEDGLYLRTSSHAQRLANLGAVALSPSRWSGRELWAPCFETTVVGTTGSGDSTIAGFLAGLLEDTPPEAALALAVGVGAYSVEAPDATSGIPSLAQVERRIRRGWARKPTAPPLRDWTWDPTHALWVGPADALRGELRGFV